MKKLNKAGLFMELKMVMPKVRKEEGTEAKPFLAGTGSPITVVAPSGDSEKASVRFKETVRDYEKADDKRDAGALQLIEVMPETAERITKACKAARSGELGSLGQGWMEGFGN